MTLTPQNMRTDPSGNAYSPAALREDVTHMDGKQLKKYIRLAFQGEVDPKFLPVGSDFWRAWGSTHPQAGRFFAGIYTTMPHALDGSFTRADRSKLDFDPQYAVRFESILKKFLEECINYQGKPTRRKLMIAQGCVDAVDDIRFHSGPNSPEMQFIRPLQEKDGINGAEALKLAGQISYPSDNDNQLYGLVSRLQDDARYASLDFGTFKFRR